MVHLTNQLIIKMKKQKNIARILALAIICATILMIGMVTAIYPGETETYLNEMGKDNLIYTIVGNSSPVDIEVTLNSSNITIYLPAGAAPDKFYLVFLENQTNTVVQTVRVGGGGSSLKTIYRDRNVIRDIPRNITLTEEIDKLIEVPIETIVEVETGYEWWHVLMAFIFAVIVSMIIIHFYLEAGVKNGINS